MTHGETHRCQKTLIQQVQEWVILVAVVFGVVNAYYRGTAKDAHEVRNELMLKSLETRLAIVESNVKAINEEIGSINNKIREPRRPPPAVR